MVVIYFDECVVIVIGVGNGLGKSYVMEFV